MPVVEQSLHQLRLKSMPFSPYLGLLIRLWRIASKNPSGFISILFLICVLIIALWPGLLTDYDPFSSVDEQNNIQPFLAPPMLEHPFGTDQLGRDLLSRVLYGTRVSLQAGGIIVVVALSVGTILGMAIASIGGVLDDILMRIADVLLAFPPLLIAIVFMGYLGPGLQNGLIALTIAWLPLYIRLARGLTLSALQSGYVLSTYAIGATHTRVLRRHILPNIIPPIIIKGSIDLGQAILITGALSFLGLGVQPPTPELGALVTQGREYILTAWWYSTFPGLMIFLIVLALNFLGDGVRDILDPTTARQR